VILATPGFLPPQITILSTQAAELQAAYAPWLGIEVADEDDGWILMTGRKAG